MAKKPRNKKGRVVVVDAAKKAFPGAAVGSPGLSSSEKALIVKVLDLAINARLPVDAQATSAVLKKLRVK